MSESRTDAAIGRIESALARIETQAALIGSGAEDQDELKTLRKQHEDLRAAVGGSLSELDALIAEMER